MNPLETLQELLLMHRTALMSAVNADQPQADTYRELASELHESMDSITHGVNPEAVVDDLFGLWTATATECGSRDVEALYSAWAAMLPEEGN